MALLKIMRTVVYTDMVEVDDSYHHEDGTQMTAEEAAAFERDMDEPGVLELIGDGPVNGNTTFTVTVDIIPD